MAREPRKEEKIMDYGTSSSSVKKYTALILVGIIVLLGVITLFSSMRSVDTGKVGVVTQYGAVTGRELEEGFAWVLPWGVNNVTEYDVKTLKEEQQSTAATKDLQDVNAKVVVNFSVERGKVSEIHRSVGVGYKDVLITPAIQSAFKANTAKYNALDLVNKRGEAEAEVKNELINRLASRGITVENVSIIDLTYSPEFTKSIESRQVAEQNAQRAQYNLEQARLDAQAQQVQAETLTDNYLRLKEIENENKAIDKWNGQMPSTVAGGQSIFSIPTQR